MCFSNSKRKGFDSTGKRRFVCLSCHRTFGKPKHIPLNFSAFVMFHDFIVNKINKEVISERIFLSRKTIWRRFKPFFNYAPTPSDSLFLLEEKELINNNAVWVIGIDGKWLHRSEVVMIYRNITVKINLFWSWHPSESYEAMTNDFMKLIPIIKNSLPSGIVTDWKGAIVSAVNWYLPNIPHQRCLTHVKRSLTGFLPLRSPILATRKLRTIAQRIIMIGNKNDKILWKKDVVDWITKYDNLLKEKTKGVNTKKKWWYTHGNLRRAIKLLNFDEKYLFTYLDYPFLSKTNNSLEGLNSQIKTKIANHRGMKIPQQVIYIFWLLTFSRVKTKKDLKRLWDKLKFKIFRN